MPGDQLTLPQIYGSGIAQALYAGDSEDSAIEDKTLITQFCAPRIVLKSDMPTATVTITAEQTIEPIKTIMLGGINEDASFMALVNKFFDNLAIDEIIDGEAYLKIDEAYNVVFAVGNDQTLRALGVILSRYDSARQKWLYSTSNLVCVWDFLSQNDGADYFGFTVDNAIATYRAAVVANTNGNFLQRGGTPDIVPASFR